MATAKLIAFLLSSLLSGPAQTQPGAASAGNVLSCSEPVYDFGEVWDGEVVEHEFKVTNRGDEILYLEAAAGCQCTSTEKNYTIAPGQTIPVRVRFNTEGKTNDEAGSSVTLKVIRTEKPVPRA